MHLEKQRLKLWIVVACMVYTGIGGLFAQEASPSSPPIISAPISKIDTPLPRAFLKALPKEVDFQPGSPILRTAQHIGGNLLLAPSLEGASTVVSYIDAASKASNLIIEALVFLPASSSATPYNVAAQLDALGLIFNQFSSLQGIQYWSASRKIMRTLYTDAYRVDDPKTKHKLKDPETVGELHALLQQRAYVYQKDQTFGGVVIEVQCSMSQTTFLMMNTNATPLRLIGIPVLPVDGLRTGFLAAPSPDGVLLYFVTSIQSPSVGRSRVFESASNKALALLHWFTETAAARHLIEPVNLPWNFDDLPPEARLGVAADKGF
ncbi:MAG TPA: hypothetical protein DDZ37_05180 [Spirochaetaceae bacterium]|nr:hypothetical protein [Spirochaetaceae bacterium]